MKAISTLLKEVVPRMEQKLLVNSSKCIENLDGTWTLLMCKTYWIHSHTVLKDQDNKDVVITDFTTDEYITIEVDSCPTYLIIPAPIYVRGTVRMTKAELGLISDDGTKFPMIYNYEDLEEDVSRDESDYFERLCNLRLFFLSSNNYSDWTTDDHYAQVTQPMYNMAESFVDMIESSFEFGDVKRIKIYPRNNWGEFKFEGHHKKIFNEDASGVEIKLVIPVKRGCFENKCY